MNAMRSSERECARLFSLPNVLVAAFMLALFTSPAWAEGGRIIPQPADDFMERITALFKKIPSPRSEEAGRVSDKLFEGEEGAVRHHNIEILAIFVDAADLPDYCLEDEPDMMSNQCLLDLISAAEESTRETEEFISQIQGVLRERGMAK